ncbi:hypothetical protein BSLG_005831 [Batrachochytrium salamandrivorans]|nr:hypothetical protein BSLG_005831 [Batrachochytrium salamandrivorans]
MFLLKSLGNIVFGENESSLIELKSGQLFYLDPSSTKSSRLLIFRDASLSVRRTTTKFNYQLVVTRIYEEVKLNGCCGSDDLDDEHSFLLDSLLRFDWFQKERLLQCPVNRKCTELNFYVWTAAWFDLGRSGR